MARTSNALGAATEGDGMIYRCPEGCEHDFGWSNPYRPCKPHGARWAYYDKQERRYVDPLDVPCVGADYEAWHRNQRSTS